MAKQFSGIPKIDRLISETSDIFDNCQSYLSRTEMIYQKYLKRRVLAKEDTFTQKDNLDKAKRIFDDELRAA